MERYFVLLLVIATAVRAQELVAYYRERGFSSDRSGNRNIRLAGDAAWLRGEARTAAIRVCVTAFC